MIGKMIRKRREELGLTQEELAKKLGYKSKSTINKIETELNDITQSKIVAFAKVLKTSPAYLMGWEEPGESKSFSSYPRSIEDELCDMIYDFNEEGKEKVLEYAKDLKVTDRYKKFDKSGVG